MTFITTTSVYNEYTGSVLRTFIDTTYHKGKFPPVEVFQNHTAYLSFDTMLKTSPARSAAVTLSMPFFEGYYDLWKVVQDRLDENGIMVSYIDMFKAEYRVFDIRHVDIRDLNTNAKIIISLFRYAFIMNDEMAEQLDKVIIDNIDDAVQCMLCSFYVMHPDQLTQTTLGNRLCSLSYGEEVDQLLSDHFDRNYKFERTEDFDMFVRKFNLFPYSLKKSNTFEYLKVFKDLM